MPRCCLIAKTLYGGLAEAICEELFSYGRLTCSDTIRKVALRLEQPLPDVSHTHIASCKQLGCCSQKVSP